MDSLQEELVALQQQTMKIERKCESELVYMYNCTSTVYLVSLRVSANVTATYIGFQAYRSTENDVDGDVIIVYDTVIGNVGDGYNSNTGRFTCPVTGYYFFQVVVWTFVSARVTSSCSTVTSQIVQVIVVVE